MALYTWQTPTIIDVFILKEFTKVNSLLALFHIGSIPKG